MRAQTPRSPREGRRRLPAVAANAARPESSMPLSLIVDRGTPNHSKSLLMVDSDVVSEGSGPVDQGLVEAACPARSPSEVGGLSSENVRLVSEGLAQFDESMRARKAFVWS
jgi:hypothetical protein